MSSSEMTVAEQDVTASHIAIKYYLLSFLPTKESYKTFNNIPYSIREKMFLSQWEKETTV